MRTTLGNWIVAGIAGIGLLATPHSRADAVLLDSSQRLLQTVAAESRSVPQPPLIAREALMQPPVINEVQLAADGRHLLFRHQDAQRTEWRLLDLDSREQTRVLAKAEGVQANWAGDGQRIWLHDKRGLAVYELGSAQLRRIHQWDEDRRQRFWALDPTAPDYALISERIEAAHGWHYRYLRIAADGRSELLSEGPWPLRDALLDREGRLRFSVGYDGPQYDSVIHRHDPRGAEELLRCRGIERCILLGYADQGDSLYALSHHGAERSALLHWQRGQGWQTLHTDPLGIADAGQVLWSRARQHWLAIAYQSDRLHWYGNTPEHSATLQNLQQRVPGANLSLDASADGERWLVRAWQSNRAQDRYFLFTPRSRELQTLFADAGTSSLQPESLSRKVPISWRAADGMRLHGYVSVPLGIDAAKAPLIALIHGGPYNRDRDDFDGLVQLLTNRGYAVLQPNFRGSTGYGVRYARAAGGEFGRGPVLGDIVSGLDAVLAAGIGDAQRQAVMGHSFGAYASLLAASHHRDRFRFALASAAPVDFSWVMHWIADNDGSALPEDGPPAEVLFPHYGVPFSDAGWRQRMQNDAPLNMLPALNAPIYLWAGARDDRVPLTSISRYAAEAQRAGQSPLLLVDPEAGHNPSNPLSYDALLYLYEFAAAQHLGGRLQPPSDDLQRFLRLHTKLGGERVRHVRAGPERGHSAAFLP